ncbi:MAG: SUF system NifU family Fe-S cluster assembly protein [Gammaproteobacteria bacterium]
MGLSALYRQSMLEHARQPHHFGSLDGAQVVARRSNPLCGDDVEVGVWFDGERLTTVSFHGSGCSVCIASGSLMTDAVCGKDRRAVRELVDTMQAWFTIGEGAAVPATPPSLEALSPVRDFPARRRCVLLAWDALDEALARLS